MTDDRIDDEFDCDCESHEHQQPKPYSHASMGQSIPYTSMEGCEERGYIEFASHKTGLLSSVCNRCGKYVTSVSWSKTCRVPVKGGA